MSRWYIASGVLVIATISGRAWAGDDFTRTDACDDLALARAADRAGDAALSAYLQGDRYQALLAIRASEYARAPERLIPALAAHACGRDPTLAPEAALILRKVSARLVPSELAAREVLRTDLQAARAALACADASPLPRADIIAALHVLEASLAD